VNSTSSKIPHLRLRNQHITRAHRGSPAELVAHLGAVQAQEYPFAKWALALRLGNRTTDADIEKAFEAGQILRTHVMRPTWHFVAAADIGWMLELTARRVHMKMTPYARRQGLDARLLTRATAIVERALGGGKHLTRADLGARLARAGIGLTPLQLGLVALHAELERVICSGPRRGKQFTYALIGERAPGLRQLSRDEALAELTRRFVGSHAPATIRDFVWWSGLTTADARRGLDMIKATSFVQDGLTYWSVESARRAPSRQKGIHLLPIYDEYLVAYRDRVAVPHGPSTVGTASSALQFRHALVIDGQIAGTWRVDRKAAAHSVGVTALRPLTQDERRGIEAAAARYGRFMGTALRDRSST